MQYQEAKLGRIFVAKIEHGDDLLGEIKKLARIEQIKAANFFVLGAIEKSSFVGGPSNCTVPPEPVWCNFADGRELVGVGTIFTDGQEPVLHLHGVFGKEKQPLMGCIRADTQVYLLVEVIIYELLELQVQRELDPQLGVKVLSFFQGSKSHLTAK